MLPLDSQIQERRQVNARPETETPFSKPEMQNIISRELSFVKRDKAGEGSRMLSTTNGDCCYKVQLE